MITSDIVLKMNEAFMGVEVMDCKVSKLEMNRATFALLKKEAMSMLEALSPCAKELIEFKFWGADIEEDHELKNGKVRLHSNRCEPKIIDVIDCFENGYKTRNRFEVLEF